MHLYACIHVGVCETPILSQYRPHESQNMNKHEHASTKNIAYLYNG